MTGDADMASDADMTGGREMTGGEMARLGSEPAGDAAARLTAWIAGRVQGVGFRWWVRARALELGLAGSVENLEDGRVKVRRRGPGRALPGTAGPAGGPGHARPRDQGDPALG